MDGSLGRDVSYAVEDGVGVGAQVDEVDKLDELERREGDLEEVSVRKRGRDGGRWAEHEERGPLARSFAVEGETLRERL